MTQTPSRYYICKHCRNAIRCYGPDTAAQDREVTRLGWSLQDGYPTCRSCTPKPAIESA